MTDLITLDAITPAVESQLILLIQQAMQSVPANSDVLPGRSKVLRLGWSYDDPTQWVADIPTWLSDPLCPLVAPMAPDNVTINKYAVGKGLDAHLDSKAFGDPIVVFSLGSCATMLFHPPSTAPIRLFMPARSMVTMTGRMRSEWKHSITADRTDIDGLGVRHDRETRISVVLRKKL